MNLTFASQLFSKLEGRVQKGGRGRGAVVETRVAGKGKARGWESGNMERGQGEQRSVWYLLRLPAPPAPPSLGTFCCGLSTSCA